jgi:ElaB/YqjD/DUF883 family membrane-anchored ribosome-binding protein
MSTNTSTRQSTGNEAGTTGDKVASGADQAQSTASDMMNQAKTAASSAASQARQQASGLFSGQIATGTELVRNIAGAATQAADILEKSNPQFAGMIRNAAGAADQFSHQIEDTTFEELVDRTTEFARRQPALFVGGAFAAGFLLARFAKSSAGTRS